MDPFHNHHSTFQAPIQDFRSLAGVFRITLAAVLVIALLNPLAANFSSGLADGGEGWWSIVGQILTDGPKPPHPHGINPGGPPPKPFKTKKPKPTPPPPEPSATPPPPPQPTSPPPPPPPAVAPTPVPVTNPPAQPPAPADPGGSSSPPIAEEFFSPVPVPVQPRIGSQGQYLIPLTQRPVTVDGTCYPWEYQDGIKLTFTDGDGSQAALYLEHDDQYLYACFSGAPGSFAQRFVGMYLDPDNARETFPHLDDTSFRVGFLGNNILGLQGGNSPSTYIPVTLPGWTAASKSGGNDVAEFSISLQYTGCANIFGLAAFHHWVTATGNDYGWPTNQGWDQPASWAKVQLTGPLPQSCANLLAVTP